MASSKEDGKTKARNVIQSYRTKPRPPLPPRVIPTEPSTVYTPSPNPKNSRSAVDPTGTNVVTQPSGPGQAVGSGAGQKEILVQPGVSPDKSKPAVSVSPSAHAPTASIQYRAQMDDSSQGPNSTRGGSRRMPTSGSVPPVYCNICSSLGGQDVATRFCFTCTSARCSKCTGKHDSSPTLSRHVSVDIKDAKLESIVCQEHSSQCVVCFCLTCSKPVCSLCIQWEHETHSRAEFKMASRESKSKFKAVEAAFSDTRNLIKSQQHKHEMFARSKEEKRQDFRRKVHAHLQVQIELLRHEQTDLLEQYDAIYEREGRDVNMKCGKLDKLLQSLTGMNEEFNNINLPLPWHDAIILDKEISVQAVSTISQEVRKADSDTASRSTDFKFVPGPNSRIGNIEKVYSNIVTSAEQIEASARTIQPASDRVAIWRSQDQSCVTDIVVLNHNCDVLCVTGFWPNKAMSMFDLLTGNSKQAPTFLKPHSRGIMKLASRFENLAVLSKKSENDRCELTMYNKHNYLCTFLCKDNCEPRAIVVTDSGNVVMATINENVLLCYSAIGQLLWTYAPSLGAGLGGFQLPRGLALDKNDQVFMADIQAHQVHVYRHEDHYTRSFPPQVTETINPVGVCLDHSGDLFVAFGKPLCVISKFAASGLLLKHVLKIPFEPTAVQFVEDRNYLLIGTYGNGLWVCRGDEELIFRI